MKRFIFFWILVVLPLFAVYAQQNVQFYATCNAKKVVEKSYVDVRFVLKNADGTNFRAPQFKNFRILNGPNRSMSTTITNGQMSKEMSYGYTLRPLRKGRLTIESATIDVDGKTLKTAPLLLEVIEGNANEESDVEDIFVKAELQSENAWIGQQLLLDYKLYTTVNIESYNVVEESDYQGFFPQDIKRFDGRLVQEVVDGVQYTTKVIKRMALYPQQAGALEIEPLFIQMAVSTDGGNRHRSLLFNPNLKRLNVETAPVVITVKPLPDNAPASFTGAVGSYRVSTRLSRNTVTTDDVLSLRMTVQGDGDLKRIQPPPLQVDDIFEVYDPKVIDEGLYELNGEIVGKKEFEYLLLPKKEGTYRLQPRFTYFDPDSAAYITFDENIYEVNVRKGSNKPRQDINLDKDVVSNDDINYLKLDTQLHKDNGDFTGSALFWSLFTFPFLLLGGVFIQKRVRTNMDQVDPQLLKKQRARAAALKRLSQAERYMAAVEPKSFYDEVSKAMLGYVCDKLHIPLSELTKNNVKGKLEAIQVDSTHIDRYMKIISTCEMALFAGMDNADAMKETYESAVQVLADIEAAA